MGAGGDARQLRHSDRLRAALATGHLLELQRFSGRRSSQLPKSQVFVGTQPPPPPPSSGARTLDLSRPTVFIEEPGLYILDRDWTNVSSAVP